MLHTINAWGNGHPIEFTILCLPVVVTVCMFVMHWMRKL